MHELSDPSNQLTFVLNDKVNYDYFIHRNYIYLYILKKTSKMKQQYIPKDGLLLPLRWEKKTHQCIPKDGL